MNLSAGLRGLASLVLLFGVSCAHAPEVAPKTKSESSGLEAFFPLVDGNVWHYEGKMLGQPVNRTVTLVGRDGAWFVDSEGERFRFDGEGLRSPTRYLLKTPVETGTEWTSVVSVSSTERYRIAAVGLVTVTKAGRFENCVAVLVENRQDATTLLFKRDVYCPGVGLTRFETWAEVKGKGKVPAATLELSRYEVKAPPTP